MLLRDFLNEFELDYAQAPARVKKYKFGELNSKEILIIGNGDDTFARGIIYSFLNLNDQKELNIKVSLLPIGDIDRSVFIDELVNRDDFFIKEYDDISDCEYIILTGLCNKKVENNSTSCANIIRNYTKVFEKISQLSFERLVLMSDYRVNGKLPTGMIASEYEKFDDINNFEQMILQSIESLCICYSKENNFNYTILRSAIAYGPYINFDGSDFYEFTKFY